MVEVDFVAAAIVFVVASAVLIDTDIVVAVAENSAWFAEETYPAVVVVLVVEVAVEVAVGVAVGTQQS